MIDFKSEILAKRLKEDKKVDLYNSVVKEYVGQIKDIFEYDNLKVDCQEVDGLIKINIVSEDEKTKYHFSYNDIKRYLYINTSDDLADKGMIEEKLKQFVLRIAEREDIRIKETPTRGLRAKSGNIIDEACDMSIPNARFHHDPKILSAEDTKLIDELYDLAKNSVYSCKSTKDLDIQIKNLEESLEVDRYFELNEACKQIEKELENNKSIDKIQLEKHKCLDWYDEKIKELQDELKNIYPPILYHNKNTGNISNNGLDIIKFMEDLLFDIDEGNNITGDLEYLIRGLEKWKKELGTNVLNQLRDELVNEILEEARN